MDCDIFDDLFDEVDELEGSSQDSLTNAAANLVFSNSDEENLLDDVDTLVLSSEDRILCSGADVGNGAVNLSQDDNAKISKPAEQPANSPFSPTTPTTPPTDLHPIEKIEWVFSQMSTALMQSNQDISITLKTRKPKATITRHPMSAGNGNSSIARSSVIRFPGKSPTEAWRFTIVVRILELMHEALRHDTTVSKRDIYYRDPALFGSQAHVDRHVDDIARTFAVSRSALNVTAVAKGLLMGALTFCRRDGTVIQATVDNDGILVPKINDILSVSVDHVRWILVVEKEATLRSIAAGSFSAIIAAQGVLLTGKGYPDIATRAILHLLSTPSARNGFASPPVFGMFDYDPDGMAIMSTYKHGSAALAHENADLICPSLRCLGLRSKHITEICDVLDDTHINQGLLTLTKRDRNKARQMLEWAIDDEELDEWKEELRRMLVLGFKAELQLLDAVPNGMHVMLERSLPVD